MGTVITRKNFLHAATFTGSGLLLAPYLSQAKEFQQEKPPTLQPELVKEFVIAGHGNLEKVKQMLAQQPALLNACWDWGGGDFETAIEGAGHTGSKDCANYLLANGARMNVFCGAMLGKLDFVKALLTAFPNLKESRGPHGLQLIHHAAKGGDNAKDVLVYLQLINAK